MARKVILDVDPGIDDAMALCLALSDPELDVVAVTATGGNISPAQATRNVQAILEQLDPVRRPRIGSATTDYVLPTDARHLHGPDGLGGAQFRVAELHHRHPSDKVICDAVRAAPEEVTIVALGPLTNIAAALQRDPGLATLVGHLIIMGGAVTSPGNVTAAAEFNIYCNPDAARLVFRSPVTKTLIPLDVSSQVVMTLDVLDQLPGQTSRTGALLRKILPAAFRSYRQQLGLEGIPIHDAVAMMAVTHPSLFRTESMIGDVETAGCLTLGATVFDRRRVPEGQPNMEVALDIDAPAVLDRIVRRLAVS
ncbi:MAG: nucleoside hydrolase [Planctomycetia bacterium]|nr:MAG: nucleoside hydrolase [Planctomycetia bacterium]